MGLYKRLQRAPVNDGGNNSSSATMVMVGATMATTTIIFDDLNSSNGIDQTRGRTG